MPKSMTGFASGEGLHGPWRWSCEIRSVNGKGLDLRLRVPDWIDGLEHALRTALATKVKRGNVTLSVKVARDGHAAGHALNRPHLAVVLDALAQIEAEAASNGLRLSPVSASDIAQIKGVLEPDTASEEDLTGLRAALVSAMSGLIASFDDMRAREGAALSETLARQLSDVEAAIGSARAVLDQRAADMAERLHANLSKVAESVPTADPERVAQELAMIAVKADVTEELDRLDAHVAAARDLLGSEQPAGRKLDFLMQEFNREANTLCAKAQHGDLTRIGLALKVLIDQMREQVHNLE